MTEIHLHYFDFLSFFATWQVHPPLPTIHLQHLAAVFGCREEGVMRRRQSCNVWSPKIVSQQLLYFLLLLSIPLFNLPACSQKIEFHSNRFYQKKYLCLYIFPVPIPNKQRVMWLRWFCLISTAILVSIVQASSNTKPWSENIRVALHAQVSPSQGFIVGSVITTAGTFDVIRCWEMPRKCLVFGTSRMWSTTQTFGSKILGFPFY